MATNNGWVNPAAKREFLRVLIESNQNNFGKERILFLYDGHFTNHDYELLKLCWAHDLVPMVIPPHLTHLMNPMDMKGGVFFGIEEKDYERGYQGDAFESDGEQGRPKNRANF